MELKITECEGLANGGKLLLDLGTYNTVEKWIRAMLKRRSFYYPLYLTVVWNKRPHAFISGGDVSPKAEEWMEFLEKYLSPEHGDIPNDRMIISSDIFESELYIDLNVQLKPKRGEKVL